MRVILTLLMLALPGGALAGQALSCRFAVVWTPQFGPWVKDVQLLLSDEAFPTLTGVKRAADHPDLWSVLYVADDPTSIIFDTRTAVPDQMAHRSQAGGHAFVSLRAETADPAPVHERLEIDASGAARWSLSETAFAPVTLEGLQAPPIIPDLGRYGRPPLPRHYSGTCGPRE